MLNTNKKVFLESQFLEAYQSRVAQRLNLGGWNIPVKWRDKVKPILEVIQKEGIKTIEDLELYIKSVFKNFPRSKCRRLYKLAYPPIFLLKNKYSFQNFIQFQLQEASFIHKEKTESEIIEIVKKEYSRTNCSISGSVNMDQLKFSIMNGSVSLHTVAFVAISFEFSKELLNEFYYFIKDATNENFIHYYNFIEILINKGAFNNVKTFKKP